MMYKLRFINGLFVLFLFLTFVSCTNESRGQEDEKKRVFISTDMAAGLVGGWRGRAAPDTDDSWAVELISTYAGGGCGRSGGGQGKRIFNPLSSMPRNGRLLKPLDFGTVLFLREA